MGGSEVEEMRGLLSKPRKTIQKLVDKAVDEIGSDLQDIVLNAILQFSHKLVDNSFDTCQSIVSAAYWPRLRDQVRRLLAGADVDLNDEQVQAYVPVRPEVTDQMAESLQQKLAS